MLTAAAEEPEIFRGSLDSLFEAQRFRVPDEADKNERERNKEEEAAAEEALTEQAEQASAAAEEAKVLEAKAREQKEAAKAKAEKDRLEEDARKRKAALESSGRPPKDRRVEVQINRIASRVRRCCFASQMGSRRLSSKARKT